MTIRCVDYWLGRSCFLPLIALPRTGFTPSVLLFATSWRNYLIVSGIQLNVRWCRNFQSTSQLFYIHSQVRFAIGETLKQVLDLEASTLIEYKHHEVAMQDMSTFRYEPVRDEISIILNDCVLCSLPLSSIFPSFDYHNSSAVFTRAQCWTCYGNVCLYDAWDEPHG